MKRAALYLRVSTDEQTVANQLPALEQIAQARGLDVVATYSENTSAWSGRARPEFDRMMSDAKRGAFDVLLVWAIDRLGRSMHGVSDAIRVLDHVGVAVVSHRESWLDLDGPTRGLLVAIFGWIGEQESAQRSARTKAGLARAVASGKRLGRRHRMSPTDVTRARALRAAGRSLRQIAVALKIPRATIARSLAASHKRVGAAARE